jgi:hypothetical protein
MEIRDSNGNLLPKKAKTIYINTSKPAIIGYCLMIFLAVLAAQFATEDYRNIVHSIKINENYEMKMNAYCECKVSSPKGDKINRINAIQNLSISKYHGEYKIKFPLLITKYANEIQVYDNKRDKQIQYIYTIDDGNYVEYFVITEDYGRGLFTIDLKNRNSKFNISCTTKI